MTKAEMIEGEVDLAMKAIAKAAASVQTKVVWKIRTRALKGKDDGLYSVFVPFTVVPGPGRSKHGFTLDAQMALKVNTGIKPVDVGDKVLELMAAWAEENRMKDAFTDLLPGTRPSDRKKKEDGA